MAVCELSLAGKTALITGASSGLGRAAAFHLAKANARVLMACRDLTKADKVAADIKSRTGNINVIVQKLDLCSFRSVKECATSILQTEKKLDILINNAGISGVPYRVTEDCQDIVMQANYLGHFLLTKLLLDLLKQSKPSRIVNVSSCMYKYSKLDVDNLNRLNRRGWDAYNDSKLANILFTNELAKILVGTGVTVNSVHPGIVKTDLARDSPTFERIITKIFFTVAGKTPEVASESIVKLAADPNLEGVTGKYFEVTKETELPEKFRDESLATRLFENSEAIVQNFL